MNRRIVICACVAALLAVQAGTSWGVLRARPQSASAHRIVLTGAPDTCSAPLVAARHFTIGTVDVSCPDGSNLVVKYVVTDGYSSLRATHLYLGATPPAKAAPGQFPFKHENISSVTDQYVVALSALHLARTSCVYIAAHAEVKTPIAFRPPRLCAFNASLPDVVQMVVSYPGGGDSYLDAEITGGGAFNGVYDDWCVDTAHEISPGDLYDVEVFSSYEALPTGLVDFPANLDLVNYVINQGYIGQPSSNGEPFTFGDVQRAIWNLVEDLPEGEGLGEWSQSRVDEILAEAHAHGEKFVPGCNDLIAVLLRPIDDQGSTVGQVTFIEVPFRCTPIMSRETAWGAGGYLFRTGWGSYFRCCPAP